MFRKRFTYAIDDGGGDDVMAKTIGDSLPRQKGALQIQSNFNSFLTSASQR